MTQRGICTLLAILAAGCGAQDPGPQPTASAPPAIRAAAPAPAADGRAIYNYRCYFCHGYSGNARTLAATYLVPAPRDFTASTPMELPRERVLRALRNGIPGTAMKPFSDILTDVEIEAVATFVHDEFVVRKAVNTRYHTAENGWPDHQRYRAAFPFALGEISLTQDISSLSPTARQGRDLYLGSCVSCHDRGKPTTEDSVVWDGRPLSYPRNNYDHRQPEVDAKTSATPYHIHDRPPKLDKPTFRELRGERIFQDNCAFCHAADGTGKNWIGSFLEPHPRNLTDPAFMSVVSREHLRKTIREGLPGTSMPAWKSVLTEEDIDSLIAYISLAFHPIGR